MNISRENGDVTMALKDEIAKAIKELESLKLDLQIVSLMKG